MDQPVTDKKESRAARVPEKGRRATVTFRCLPDVQAKIQEAAAKSGRSASEEIERRVEKSFETSRSDAVIQTLLGGNIPTEIAKDLVSAIKYVDIKPDTISYELYRSALMKAVEGILAFRLPDQIPLSSAVDRAPDWEKKCARAEMFGDHVARMVLNDWWASLVEGAERQRADLPSTSDEEKIAFADSPGLMGAWTRDEISRRKDDG